MASPTVQFRTLPDRLEKPGVLIVGFTEHRKLAFDEARFPRGEWERWTLNEIHRWVDYREIDRWFEIHPREDLEGDPEHLKALAGMDIPVYMQRHHDDIPPSVPFPAGQVEARVGKYETSSIAWMMGLAITFGAKRIAIVGVDMATDTEYANERPCVEYMIGLARGMGIEVWVPPTSDLLKAVGQYGFGAVGSEFASKLKERIGWLHGQDNEWLAQVRKLEGEYEETKARMRFDQRRQRDKLDAEYRAKRDQLLANRWQVMGAIQDCDFWKRSWAVTGGHEPGKPTPDRTQDPRTGIKATVPGTDSKDEGAPNRVAKEMAA